LLLWLATGSGLLVFAGLCCPPAGGTAALLGFVVLSLARRDEALMRKGAMDPAGLPDLESARHTAHFGITMGLMMLFLGGGVWLFYRDWRSVLRLWRDLLEP
jgi:hypothetical protein